MVPWSNWRPAPSGATRVRAAEQPRTTNQSRNTLSPKRDLEDMREAYERRNKDVNFDLILFGMRCYEQYQRKTGGHLTRRTIFAWMIWVLGVGWVVSVPSTLSRAQESVSFTRDIQPILQNSCWKCHGEAMQLSKLDLRTLEGALKGGEKGAAIVPCKAEDSRLYRRVAGLERPAMPMDSKLTSEQIAAIKAWIDEGAHWDTGTAAKAPSVDRAALAALENMEISPEARNYWAFRLPVQ